MAKKSTEYDEFNIKFLSIIAYIGPLFIMGKLSVERNNRLVRFHATQGMILFLFEIIGCVVALLLNLLLSPFPVISELVVFMVLVLVTVISVLLAIMGVVSATKDRCTQLPFIGWTDKFFSNK